MDNFNYNKTEPMPYKSFLNSFQGFQKGTSKNYFKLYFSKKILVCQGLLWNQLTSGDRP